MLVPDLPLTENQIKRYQSTTALTAIKNRPCTHLGTSDSLPSHHSKEKGQSSEQRSGPLTHDLWVFPRLVSYVLLPEYIHEYTDVPLAHVAWCFIKTLHVFFLKYLLTF